ncbi:ABC transporter permease [Tunturibacter empetritectus]|uniref:Permease n=1 Tax=Tunturiibacter lichenicola TaxID=2051959 RepID=A0A7W8J8C5_9BACT|nr:ABC transporter permease [Edaphobacter lichenicola]MBB5344398.1 putative permease [Edaphobacter lichenicola]
MRRLRAFWMRVLGALSNSSGGTELADELESHLQMHIEDNVRSGMSEEEARRQALIRLGGLEQTRQAYRERQGLPGIETLWQDIRFGLRVLGKSRGFTVVAVLTLALGIGANTALFSVINAVLLNPLPYPHSEELLTVHAAKQNFNEGSISYLNFRDWQRDNKTLSALAVSRGTGYILTGTGASEEVRGELVSSEFFPLLGVKPVMGRLFAQHEDEIGQSPVAMISAGFWQRKLGGRPDVIGKALTLDGRDYVVVGVMPASFNLAINNFRASDIYVPIGQFQNPALSDRAAGLGIHGIARLKPGVTLEQAQADMERVSRGLEATFPAEDQGIRARLVPFKESLVREVRPLLVVLMGAVVFVLLIACVNVANLLLARSNVRAQEFAVRSALGASRGRLLRQLLTESLILSVLGGGLGLVLAAVGTQALVKMLPQGLPRAAEIHLSWLVLCFTALISLASGTLFGFAPAMKMFKQNVQSALKSGGRGTGVASHRMQDSLVILQMASALVLLIGAGLMIRSMVKLSNVDPGFRSKGVMTFGLEAAPEMKGASPDAMRAYLREAQRRTALTPDVEAVSFSWAALPMISDDEQFFWLEGEPKPASQNTMRSAIRYLVGADYLRVMGIPLLRGRFLLDTDDEKSQRVIVIDDVFARKFFGDADPIGKRIHLDQFDDPALVVGVVGHVNQWGLDSDLVNPLRAETYQSMMQLPEVQLSMVVLGMDTVVRSKSGATPSFKSIERSVTQMNQEQVVYNPETMDDVISDTLATRRFAMILLAVFAGTALVLASIGMYGVISYLVGQRSREIGIRMALGADRRDVLRWVLGHGSRLALIGAGCGLIVALGLTRTIAGSSLLYGVRPYDPSTFLAVMVLMMGVALAACYIPARRATRIDPMTALRTD